MSECVCVCMRVCKSELVELASAADVKEMYMEGVDLGDPLGENMCKFDINFCGAISKHRGVQVCVCVWVGGWVLGVCVYASCVCVFAWSSWCSVSARDSHLRETFCTYIRSLLHLV